jgi:hypothetical protein
MDDEGLICPRIVISTGADGSRSDPSAEWRDPELLRGGNSPVKAFRPRLSCATPAHSPVPDYCTLVDCIFATFQPPPCFTQTCVIRYVPLMSLPFIVPLIVAVAFITAVLP